jgi:oligopeptide/dipeptide ABC transporter ATP-binding protein
VSLLTVSDLTVRYPGTGGAVVDGLSFTVERGESVGLVGESGSGKSQTALAIMGLSPARAALSGSVLFDAEELLAARPAVLRRVRARRIAMVFQDPMSALNPYRRIGDQLGYILAAHGLASGAVLRKRVLTMLDRTGLPDPERQARAYPHELSGGMRQRAMIASALIAEPELLIADEPTTALDATVQAQILALLRELRRDTGAALLLITHDLGVIAGNSDRLLVLDRGRLIEQGPTARVFVAPEHRRSRDMLAEARDVTCKAPDMQSGVRQAVLAASELSAGYAERRPFRLWGTRHLNAVRAMNLSIRPGETLAIVGESGSGKTSLARALLGLLPATGGTVSFLGRALVPRLRDRTRAERQRLQLVFQDPVGSLDPAMRVRQSIVEPLRIHQPALRGEEHESAVRRALARVGLEADLLDRFPHQLSGGQAQRVAIARALILKPQVLICDEALASLDGSVRRGIVDLLVEEQRRSALAILFISHDLKVVRQIAHRVLVMYLGQTFELADRDALFSKPRHPYTRALIDSTPVADPEVPVAPPPVRGEPASLLRPPGGCVFHPRCAYAVARCSAEPPERRQLDGTEVACHRAGELDLRSVQ